MDLKIRVAGQADADLLANVGRTSFHSTFASQNSEEDMASYLSSAFSTEKQAEEIAEPGSVFLILEDGTVPAGYARLLASPEPTCMTGKKSIELVRFYLLPEWIGTGAANTLMQAALEHARGGGWEAVWLGVWQENPRAIRFYQKWGFTIVGEHVFQIGSDAQHDWIMARDLEQGSISQS